MTSRLEPTGRSENFLPSTLMFELYPEDTERRQTKRFQRAAKINAWDRCPIIRRRTEHYNIRRPELRTSDRLYLAHFNPEALLEAERMRISRSYIERNTPGEELLGWCEWVRTHRAVLAQYF